MADSKASALTAASALDGTEVVAGVQSAADRKITTAQIVALAGVSMDASAGRVFWDDFVFGNTTSGQIGELGWTFNNGSVAYDNSGNNTTRPGIIRRTSGTTANQHNGFSPLNSPAQLLHSIVDTFRAGFKVSSTVTVCNLRVGLTNWGGTDPVLRGVYLEKLAADTNWFYVTKKQSGSVEARVDSGVAVTLDAWIDLKIRRITSTSYGFTINGGTESVLNTSAAMPLDTDTCAPGFSITPTTTTARHMEFDYIGLKTLAVVR